MSATLTAPAKPAAKKLSKPTYLLFFVAAHSHVLAEQFGVELDGDKIKFVPGVHRPWLTAHPGRPEELTFDADKYAETINACSTYTAHMRLFILNVWNPGYARSKGWTFDLFKALRGLDQGNSDAIAWFIKNQIWP